MPATTAPKASSTVATALSVNVAAVMPVFLFGGLAVQIIDELRMSVGSIGLVSGLYFAASSLTAVPAGHLVERFGAPNTARFAVGLAAASMAAVAAFAHDPVVLTALIVLSAPANGLGQLASNAVLSNWAPKRRKGILFGAKQASVPLCTMLAGLSVPVIALTLGWRWAFVAGAAVALLALIPLTGLGRPALPGHVGKGRALDRRLLVLAAATFMGAVAATPLGSFLTTYAVHIGASESFAGLNLTIGGLAGVIARTTVGAIADRRVGGEFGLIAVMLLGGCVGIAALMAGETWLLPVGTAAAFALGWAWPGLMNFAVTNRYPHAPAAATSITQTGVYAGGAVGPIAFGLIVDHAGWNTGWSVVLAAMAAAAVFILIGARLSGERGAGTHATVRSRPVPDSGTTR
ncbi:MFS transporter [Glycomyces tarimensis]